MRKLISVFIISLLAFACLASQPIFHARFDILGSTSLDSNVAFRVTGDVMDESPLGYSIADVAINDYVICDTPYGDIDRYRVTNIVSKIGITLTCDLRYDEPGYPRWEDVGAGYQIICKSSDLDVLYIPSLTWGLINEYLQNGARNQLLDRAFDLTRKGWSRYAATTDVDLAQHGLTNVQSLTLGGVNRTNWPTTGEQGPPGTNGIDGAAATITIAYASNGVPGSSVIVTNVGDSNAAQFGFVIPVGSNGLTGAKGETGTAATVGIAWTSNSPPGSSASVTNTGDSNNALLGFTLPQGSNGPPGLTGAVGPTGTAATVGIAWTSNSPPGAAASVTNMGDSNNALLGFTIPQGSNGPTGQTGAIGPTGTAATVGIAWTSNSPPGSSASVTNTGNSNNASLGFIIPQGSNGPIGPQGIQGIQGEQTNIIFYTGDTTTETGKVYQLTVAGTWTKVNNITVTNCNRVLGLAIGTNSTSDGMLFQGSQIVDTSLIVGAPVYVASTDGEWTQTLPTNMGYVVRQIGQAEETNKICITPIGVYVVIGEYFDGDYNYTFYTGTTQTFDNIIVNNINLGGDNPIVSLYNTLRGTAVGGAISNTVNFAIPFSSVPIITFTWNDNTIDQLAQPEIIQKTTNGFSWKIRTTAGISTNAWQIDWVAVE